MIEQPEFIEELIEFWTDFMLQTLEPILSQRRAGFCAGQRRHGL